MYGTFRCPFCSNDELVDQGQHKHDGFCGDREWAAELPPLSMGSGCWPVCPCCGRHAELIAPLVLAA
jgi:hypothetical protein